MDKFIVKITDDALSDMEALYSYIAIKLKASDNAINQYNRIADAILSLETFPDRYGLFECEPEHSMGIHKMVIDNYIVCYVVDSDTVTVSNVFYGASDIHKRLLARRK